MQKSGFGECTLVPWLVPLVAPYRAIPRDYLSDTPLLRAMGFLVSQHGQLGAIPPPPFLSVPPWRACEVRVRYPPTKGYLSDTCAIPFENKEKACDTPFCDTISKGYCAIWGGISHWATKFVPSFHFCILVPGFLLPLLRFLHPRSGFRGLGNIRQNHPFAKLAKLETTITLLS